MSGPSRRHLAARQKAGTRASCFSTLAALPFRTIFGRQLTLSPFLPGTAMSPTAPSCRRGSVLRQWRWRDLFLTGLLLFKRMMRDPHRLPGLFFVRVGHCVDSLLFSGESHSRDGAGAQSYGTRSHPGGHHVMQPAAGLSSWPAWTRPCAMPRRVLRAVTRAT